ncbi:MAG: hypothetical protein A3K19_16415 [Lentisphaerae bacterium RIFOXYB12_FULL_65_16]|nr:MAG: hypothetical protein A3K18_32845 [Lentisphaerae bacterium RIFOXYA12_64_32]OGV89027.1 MAG: hypothetical protein A3K19_16415 [Lentisphaerae bacterium RIFOXYB12_FULL_65_16]
MAVAQTGSETRLDGHGHIPALDGLRGIAIILVLIVHFFHEEFFVQTGSHLIIGPVLTKLALIGTDGVELFFVLSGFLITGILLDSRDDAHYFRNFYMRRVLRIFPLYYATLVAIFVVAPLFLQFDPAAERIVRLQVWLWAYLSNLPFLGRPWDDSSVFMLGHFWSLCVEEHYYLVWPAIVHIVRPKRLPWVCLGAMVLGVSCRAGYVFLGNDAPWLFRWQSLTHLDGLALGSLIAVLVRDQTRLDRHGEWFRVALRGCLVLGAAYLALSAVPRAWQATLWPYRIFKETVTAGLCGCVLAVALRNRPCGLLSAVLENPVLRSFGKYSYGLYVIHGVLRPQLWRLFSIERLIRLCGSEILAQVLHLCLCTAVCFALAVGSFHLYEAPFLRLKRYFSPGRP